MVVGAFVFGIISSWWGCIIFPFCESCYFASISNGLVWEISYLFYCWLATFGPPSNAYKLVSIDRYACYKLLYLIFKTSISVNDSNCFSLKSFSSFYTRATVSFTYCWSKWFYLSSSLRLSNLVARITVESPLLVFLKSDAASSLDFLVTSSSLFDSSLGYFAASINELARDST